MAKSRNAHVRRKPARGFQPSMYRCETHAKMSWPTRKSAKLGIRSMRGAGVDIQAMREYECSAGHGWHVGHLPKPVREGKVTIEQARKDRGQS
jgi:hypothetical protein